MTAHMVEWTAVTIEQGEWRRRALPGAADLYEARMMARERGLSPVRFEWSVAGLAGGSIVEERSEGGPFAA